MTERTELWQVGVVARHTGELGDMAIIHWTGEQPPVGTELFMRKKIAAVQDIKDGLTPKEAEAARSMLAAPHAGLISSFVIEIEELSDHGFPYTQTKRLLNDLTRSLADALSQQMSVREETIEECAKICHNISIDAFATREKYRNEDVDHSEISEQTGRYEATEECERAIIALKGGKT